MKLDPSSSADLIAASTIDALAAPASVVRQDGTLQHQNPAWNAWIAEIWPTDRDSAALHSLVPQLRHADLTKCIANGGQPSQYFETQVADTTLWVTRLTGTEKWNSGVLAVILPSADGVLDETAQTRWDSIFSASDHGFWDVDLEKGTKYFSEGWKTLRGYAPDADLSGETADWLARIHPNDRKAVRKRRETLRLRGKNTVIDEYRERHADGHWIWIMSRVRAVAHDHVGRATRLIGTETNVTPLKLHEGREDDLSQRLELAISTSGIGTWDIDIDNKRTYWDKRMYDIYGIDDRTEEIPNDIWKTSIHPEDRDAIVARRTEESKTHDDFDHSFRIIRRDGIVRHLRTKGTHYFGANGTHRIVGVSWDITTDVKHAEQLRAANALAEERNLALERARAEMEHRSHHDALTGLANRRKLDEFYQIMLDSDAPKNKRHAAVQIDLDRFKHINDTLGHAAGDQVLRHVANILRNAAPPDSLVARVGGDEFAVLIPYAPLDAPLDYWARELNKTAEKPFFFEGQPCHFGLSIGIATTTGKASTDRSLFSNADLALYQAKNDGRGTVRFYDRSMRAAAIARQSNVSEILNALDAGQFSCHYQPQYDAQTLEIVGLEALARWDHPKKGLLSPASFLDISEDLGLVARIDEIVLDQTIADARHWKAKGLHVPLLSVNVSSKRLIDPLLAHRIAHLGSCGFDFCFELLESVFLDKSDAMLSANLDAIRNLGISIDVDDFGTGHASIAGLLNLHPNRLKIDRQLILPIIESRERRNLVKSIIQIGKTLGISVVAEGVETPAHIAALQEMKCEFLQGYGLACPMSATGITQHLVPSHDPPLQPL